MIWLLYFNRGIIHAKGDSAYEYEGIVSSIIRYEISIPNNITKTKIKAIEFIGGIKLYG